MNELKVPAHAAGWMIVCALIGCSGSDPASTSDPQGTDDAAVATDTGSAAADSAAPANDSGSPSTTDTGSTPVTETASTPGTDAGSTTTETGTGTGESGKVICGDKGLVCDATTPCCISYSPISGSTYACNKTCTGFGKVSVPCDGPEDCTGGMVCCFRFDGFTSASAKCEASTACKGGTRNEAVSCHTNADCGDGMTCLGCTDPGGAIKVMQCVSGGKCPS